MTTKALYLAITVLASAGCATPLGEEPDDEANLGTTQQELAIASGSYTSPLQFVSGTPSVWSQPVGGIWGWDGAGSSAAFKVTRDSSSAGYKAGPAKIRFKTYTVPKNGWYAIQFTGPREDGLIVNGSTYVNADGWAWSDTQASAKATVWMIPTITRANGAVDTLEVPRVSIAYDATKSETRTKSFSQWKLETDHNGQPCGLNSYCFRGTPWTWCERAKWGDLWFTCYSKIPQFYAYAGDVVRVTIGLDVSAWTKDTGRAEVRVNKFGLATRNTASEDVLDVAYVRP